MKKQVVAIAALAGLALGAAIAQGSDSAGGGIIGSVHDLSGNNNGGTTGSTYGVSDPGGRICAFCHSPHHSKQNNMDWNGAAVTNLGSDAGGDHENQYFVYAPLWSRTRLSEAKDYLPYQSQTFNPEGMEKPYDPLIGPSRLCLTCHDGAIALDSYYGYQGGTAIAADDGFSGIVPGSGNIGIASKPTGLSNDHPIGMRYTDFLSTTDAPTDYELMPVNKKFIGTDNKETKSIQSVLYTDPNESSTVKDFVTCASCHDVHNGKAVGNKAPTGGLRGFLLYGSQYNSSFCLTCHDKAKGEVPQGQ